MQNLSWVRACAALRVMREPICGLNKTSRAIWAASENGKERARSRKRIPYTRLAAGPIQAATRYIRRRCVRFKAIRLHSLPRPPLWPTAVPGASQSSRESGVCWPDIPSSPLRLPWRVLPSCDLLRRGRVPHRVSVPCHLLLRRANLELCLYIYVRFCEVEWSPGWLYAGVRAVPVFSAR